MKLCRDQSPWMLLTWQQYQWIELFAYASWVNNCRDRLTDNFPHHVIEGAD
jgi:hypothetical protein